MTFDFGNGTTVKETVQYNEPINYPEGVVREGFVFNEWNPKPEVMPSQNLTITAQWNEATQFVEIIFKTADLSEAEIIGVLEKYVDSGFAIDILEVDSATGSTKVIVKFDDPAMSNEFVRNVSSAIRNGTNEYIMEVSSIKEVTASYSHNLFHPSSTLLLAYLF